MPEDREEGMKKSFAEWESEENQGNVVGLPEGTTGPLMVGGDKSKARPLGMVV